MTCHFFSGTGTQCMVGSIGLLLGLEAPVMTPKGVNFHSFLSFLGRVN